MQLDLAIQKLLDGNKRYMESKQIHPNQDIIHRAETVNIQNPFALVITCSDSRVSPEILFDQGLGDLFVVRIAGNILNEHVIGTIEYAVKYLNIPLILVLGHENCAAIDTTLQNIKTHSCMDKIFETLNQNIGQIDKNHEDVLNIAIKKNVSAVICQLKSLSNIVLESANNNDLRILGGYYSLRTGKVDIIVN